MPEAERIGQEVELEKRVELLIESTCYMVFAYVAQGLFERHKLIVATQVGRTQAALCAYLDVRQVLSLACLHLNVSNRVLRAWRYAGPQLPGLVSGWQVASPLGGKGACKRKPSWGQAGEGGYISQARAVWALALQLSTAALPSPTSAPTRAHMRMHMLTQPNTHI